MNSKWTAISIISIILLIIVFLFFRPQHITIDASSEETFITSMNRMEDSIEDQDKLRKFNEIRDIISSEEYVDYICNRFADRASWSKQLKAAQNSDYAVSQVFAHLNGLSVNEMIAEFRNYKEKHSN
jgi:hypothetical protein